MQIIDCNEMVVANVGHLLELLKSIYDDSEISLYPALKDGKLVFIARSDTLCTYIANDGTYTLFTLDENNEIDIISKEGYRICNEDGVYFVDGDDIQHIVELEQLDEKDEEDYNGQLVYRQYNPKKDIMCEMRYKHMYRTSNGVTPIFPYHAKDVDYLYITEDYDKDSTLDTGLLSKKKKYYSRISYDKRQLGYYIVALKEYGLISFLKRGNYCLEKDKEVRYARTLFVDSQRDYRDLGFLGEQKTTEELKKMIKEYGFKTEIPQMFFDVYNGQDKTVATIQEAVEALHQVNEELQKENNSKTLVFTIAE